MSPTVRAPALKGLLSALALLAAVIGGCGGTETGNDAVARVGDAEISKADYERWLEIFAARTGGQRVRQHKVQVLTLLITAEWYRQEAARRGIKLTPALAARLSRAHRQGPDAAELRRAGMTAEDSLLLARHGYLRQRLAAAAAPGETTVSEEELLEYYQRHKERYVQPKQRDIFVLRTRTKAEADQARAALENGARWKRVVSRYSLDEPPPGPGPLPVTIFTQGRGEPTLDAAIFSATPHELTGPVKTPRGWFVFEVEVTQAAFRHSFEDVEDDIRTAVRAEKAQQAVDAKEKALRDRYRSKTSCARGYEVPECGEG